MKNKRLVIPRKETLVIPNGEAVRNLLLMLHLILVLPWILFFILSFRTAKP